MNQAPAARVAHLEPERILFGSRTFQLRSLRSTCKTMLASPAGRSLGAFEHFTKKTDHLVGLCRLRGISSRVVLDHVSGDQA